MEIKIAVVVGDNGNFAACKYAEGETDWAFLSDSAGIYDDKKREVVYQTDERRFIVTALVDLPVAVETMTAVSVTEIPKD